MKFTAATAHWDFKCGSCGAQKFRGAPCLVTKDSTGRCIKRMCSVDCVAKFKKDMDIAEPNRS